jgi:predicted nucleotide-binding protein (sugar kinase/HSP70/actin superfamily)
LQTIFHGWFSINQFPSSPGEKWIHGRRFYLSSRSNYVGVWGGKAMTARIGIPRSLAYYSFYPQWKTYLEELGTEVVLSPPTTKDILDHGIKYTVTDACIPIKVFHGHVAALIGQVDYILIPRIVSIDGDATLCPKFLGLSDMIRASIKGIPPLLTPRLDIRDGRFAPMKAWVQVAKTLGVGRRKAWAAYRKAAQAGQYYEALLASRILPLEAMEAVNKWQASWQDKRPLTMAEARSGIASAKTPKVPVETTETNGQIQLAVVGYPYMLYDEYITCGLLTTLKNLGANVLTPEMVPAKCRKLQAKKQPKYLFWHYSNQVMRATYHFFDEKMIDGLIHVTAFGCGPDAMVDKLLELDCRKQDRLPYLSLCLDEHTGVAGVITRLEAFVDMLVRRKGDLR